MKTFLTPVELARLVAIRYAKARTERDGRTFVARTDGVRFFVVPLYEEGTEEEGRYPKIDAGYAAIGSLMEDQDG
jgi:hypothetical protein